MVTPIPGGTLFIAGGLTALICSSPTARFCLQWTRTRVGWLNKVLFWLEDKVGTRIEVIGNALKQTHPLPGEEGRSLTHTEYLKKYKE